jgi:hypothetical protein
LVIVVAISSLRIDKSDLIVLVLKSISSLRRAGFETVDILEFLKILKDFITVSLSKYNIKKR